MKIAVQGLTPMAGGTTDGSLWNKDLPDSATWEQVMEIAEKTLKTVKVVELKRAVDRLKQPSSDVLEPAQQVEKRARLTVACAVVVEFLGVVTPDKVKMRKVAQGVNKDVAEHHLTLPSYMAQRCQKAMTMNLN
eukprot:6157114-Amphidinium_carterae.2